ncbi:MAG: hypothetical protein ACTHLE_04275 [Agriterribacter sp.]
MPTKKTIKCYELDFGDQNLISENKEDILNWIETDMYDLDKGDELNYKITIRMMTPKELAKLPDWGN